MIRIDKYISDKYNLTRSEAKILIENGYVKFDNRNVKISFKIDDQKEEEIQKIVIDDKYLEFLKEESESKKEELTKEDLGKISIIYEDEYFYVINKKSGVISYATDSNKVTLVDIMKEKGFQLSQAEDRNGIVHRLDKDTSGLLIISKTNDSYFKLKEIFTERKIEKKYMAIVFGKFENKKGKIDIPIKRSDTNRTKMEANINGKDAITYFEVIDEYERFSVLDINIVTGRTHQIRVHLSYINHPILGDRIYSNRKINEEIKRQCLHSYRLKFIHPFTNKEMDFKIDLDQDLKDVLKDIESGKIKENNGK